MGKRGPAPTPTSLVALRGNPGKRAVNKNEPKPSAARIAIPKHLTADAKIAWKKLSPELKKLGLLTVVDVPLLSMLCTELACYWKACGEIEQMGEISEIEGADGKIKSRRPNPYVAIKKDSRAAVCSIAGQFGMSPSARSSLSVEGPPTLNSKLADLMARGKHGKG